MDLNLQLVEGPHLLALPGGHLGSGTFFVYLFSSPEAAGGRGSYRYSLACVWFWDLSSLILGQDGTSGPPAGDYELQTPSCSPIPAPLHPV